MTGAVMAAEKPWEDWPETSLEEDLKAGWYVRDNGIFQGYTDGLFHPHNNITSFQFCLVLERANIPVERDYFKSPEVLMKDTQEFLPGTAWSANPEEAATRFRTAVMIYRHKNNIENPNPPIEPENVDDNVIQAIEQMFQDKPVVWNGVKRYSKLIGLAHVIVEDARKYDIPIWLCLGQGWWETQWYTTGMSVKYNQGWGIKDSNGRWGVIKGVHSGFADYVTIEESIHAYFRLMSSSSMPYRHLIDTGQIRKALQIYCENDIGSHYATVMTVRNWCEERGII